MSLLSSNQNRALKTSYVVQNKYEAFYTGGHTELSNDGQYLFCSCGNTVKVLEIESGKVSHTIGKDDDDEFTAFTVSQDGEILATASKSGLLQQWDWKKGSVTRTWKSFHMGPVRVMTFSPDANILVTGGSDSTIKVWDIVKQYCTHNLKGASGVFSVVKFHPDPEKNLLFGAADDSTIRVWHLPSTSKPIGEFKGHFSVVTDLAFSHDGKKLISSGRDKVILIWDIEDNKLLSTIPAFEGVESVFTLPEGREFEGLNVKGKDLHIVTSGTKGILKVWNVKSSSPVYTQINSLVADESEGDDFPRIKFATYHSRWDAICVVTHEHNILFYKISDFSLLKQFIGYNDDILDVCFFGEQDSHIAVVSNSNMVKIFELATFNCKIVAGHSDLVLTVRSFATQKNRLVTGSKDNTLRMWEMNPETKDISCLFIGSGHTLSVNAVACSDEFIVSGSQDTTLKVWDVPKRQYLVIATPSLNSRCTEKGHDKDINSVAVSPNNRLIASASHDKTAKIWKSENLELCATLRGHRKGIWCIKFSPIDQVVVTSSADGTIKMWTLSNFGCIKTFEGHECSVLSISFLSHGMQLLTTASDGNMKIWTVKTNECIKTTEAHSDRAWALAVSDNEKIAVTGGTDSAIIIWKDVTEEEKAEAQAKEDNLIIQEQKLSNYIQKKKWFKALKIAILLDQPFRALNLIKEILLQPESESLPETLQKMRDDQILSLLKFASGWNMNSKHCRAAQAIINAVLKRYTPEELLKFPDIKEEIEGFLPYTERHFQRINRLQQQASFVDYMWQNMSVAGAKVTEFKVPAEPPSFKTKPVGFFEDKTANLEVSKHFDTSSEMETDTNEDLCESTDDTMDKPHQAIVDIVDIPRKSSLSTKKLSRTKKKMLQASKVR